MATARPIWVLPQDRNEDIAFPRFAVDRTDNATFARYFENDPLTSGDIDGDGAVSFDD